MQQSSIYSRTYTGYVICIQECQFMKFVKAESPFMKYRCLKIARYTVFMSTIACSTGNFNACCGHIILVIKINSISVRVCVKIGTFPSKLLSTIISLRSPRQDEVFTSSKNT